MVTLIAFGMVQAQVSVEAAWNEARAVCANMSYATRYQSVSTGAKGSTTGFNVIIARDGRFVASIRRESAASELGGVGQFPMIVVENAVEYFDGKTHGRYDSLTNELTSLKEPFRPLFWCEGLLMFWLDQREQKGWTLQSFRDFDPGHPSPPYHKNQVERTFVLLNAAKDMQWTIEVRMRDGFVTYDRKEIVVREEPGQIVQRGGGQLGRPTYQGQFLDKEPPELNWRPPAR